MSDEMLWYNLFDCIGLLPNCSRTYENMYFVAILLGYIERVNYEKNKDKIKEQGTTYLKKLKEENPEKLKEYRRTYYLKKKEKLKENNN